MKETPIDDAVKDYLESYTVNYPNEEEMDASIEFIMAEVPLKEKSTIVIVKKAKALLINSARELINFSWLFWSLNGLFLVLGIFSLLYSHFNPYLTIFTLAPLPFFVGLFEIMKSKDEGLIELEMTLKYNAYQIITSRLLVVGIFNLVLNLVISTITVVVFPELLLLKLLFSWTIPYVLVTGGAFFLALKLKGIMASGTILAVWLAFCYGALMSPQVNEFITMTNLKLVPAVGSILVGMIIWFVHIKRMRKITIGSESYEA